MVRCTRLLLAAVLLGGTASRGQAQAPPAGTPALPGPAAAADPDFLPGLPRPPDVPGSLMAPPPPGPPAPDLERPYFQVDPLLDPPHLGLPGWFADLDVGILAPHIDNSTMSLPVRFPDGTPLVVGANAARLNWTVSPRVEVGYRLPSGFGGISVSYRCLFASGSESVQGMDGPGMLRSRLDYHIGDVDWVSNEYTPWHFCDMRVRFGLRYFNTYFDAQASEPFAEAAAGSTIFDQRTTSSVWTVGPHAGLDLRKRLGFGGLAVLGNLDLSEGWGRIRQNFYAASTTSLTGAPQDVVQTISTSDAIPMLTARMGLSWQPLASPNFYLFAGGQLDYFWNTGRAGNINTDGSFFDSGVLLQLAINY